MSRRIQRRVEDRWRTGVARQVFRGAIPVRQMEGREDEIVGCPWVFQDVRFGLRLLRREPGIAATMVLTLALAIGATTTIFSVVNAVLLQQPAFSGAGNPNNGNRPVEPVPANFLDWRERATSFERMAAIEPYSFDFTGDRAGFFEALGASAAHGRTFLPEKFRPGSGVVVLTLGFWERRFGGDAGILGRSLTLDGQPYRVVGVLATDFELGIERGRGERDLYAPKGRSRSTRLSSGAAAGGTWSRGSGRSSLSRRHRRRWTRYPPSAPPTTRPPIGTCFRQSRCRLREPAIHLRAPLFQGLDAVRHGMGGASSGRAFSASRGAGASVVRRG